MESLVQAVGNLAQALSSLILPWTESATAMNRAAEAIQSNTPHVTATLTKENWKLEPPAIYDGDPNRVTAFMQECEVYFAQANVTNIEKRIYFTLFKCRGGTGNRTTIWADNIRANMLEYAARKPPNCPYEDWYSFKQAFTRQFGLFTSAEEAIEKITTIEMGTMTCEEFSRLFETYAIRSGYNEVAILREYKRGLTKGL
jgi:Retrotransposon gag protein